VQRRAVRVSCCRLAASFSRSLLPFLHGRAVPGDRRI
jgi:hypothetical protein